MKKIPIVLITDNNYVVPTIVTITSTFFNKQKKSILQRDTHTCNFKKVTTVSQF